MSRFRLVRLSIALVFCISLLPASQPALAADEPYVFRRSWGGEGSVFTDTAGIAVGPDGTLYMTNTNPYQIIVIHPGEPFFTTWGSTGSGAGQFTYPTGISVDGNGNVYVADTGNNRIQKFTSQGVFLTQ
jgi:DNA-binding beta-propeller fold protein YncE